MADVGKFIESLSAEQRAALARLVVGRKLTLGNGRPPKTAGEIAAFAAVCLDYELAVR